MALNETPTISKKGVPSFSPNLTIRMTPEYRRWLERAALHSRMTVSAFLDFAAVEYARRHGFDEKAPKR